MNLRYQVGIGETARECRVVPDNMVTMKVGMQGRVILGPAGRARARSTCRCGSPWFAKASTARPITTKLDRVPVTVPPNDSNVLFSHVAEDLTSRCRAAAISTPTSSISASIRPARRSRNARSRRRSPGRSRPRQSRPTG